MLSNIIDFLHLLAAAIWIGGMFFMEAVFYPSVAAIDPQQGGKALAVAAKRFTIIAWSCIAILIVTGIFKTPSGWLFTTSFQAGTVLLIKHLLIVMAIINGAVITFVVAPKMVSATPKPGEKPMPKFIKSQKQIKGIAATNLILGVLIILVTTLL